MWLLHDGRPHNELSIIMQEDKTKTIKSIQGNLDAKSYMIHSADPQQWPVVIIILCCYVYPHISKFSKIKLIIRKNNVHYM